MKKGAKIALGIILSLVIIAVGIMGYKIIEDLLREDGWFEPEFDNEGRYDDSVLNNMTVIYESQSDIVAWNEGYSESTACPWGFIHRGLDFFYVNNSAVLSATPGKVVVEGIAEINGEKVFVLNFLQARNPNWVKKPFFAKLDKEAKWLDQLRPAFNKDKFFYEDELAGILEEKERKLGAA